VAKKADQILLEGFERALEEDRLRMVYQPKVALKDGSLVRVEALVRWDDPELGPVEPSRFVPLAERHGLIDDLTHWGLRTILKQWLDWCEEGVRHWRIVLRCPDCEWSEVERFDQTEVERYDDVLNDATDRLIEELDRITRENMTEAVERFRTALENDDILPFDF